MQSNGHASMRTVAGQSHIVDIIQNYDALNENYDGKCQKLLSEFILLKMDKENW